MTSNNGDLTFLTPEWIQAKPSRARHSFKTWEEYISAGLQEKPDGCITKLSKTMSYMLRHGAQEQGLVLNTDGAVSVEDLLRHWKFKHYSEDDIEITVRTNAKQRFGIDMEDGRPIRVYCRQGHSNRLGLDAFSVRGMVALAPAEVPASAVHGTFKANLAPIRSEGLKAMERPIHFATAGGRSGVRGDSDVHLHVAVRQAALDGIPFFMSENGVLLTNGCDGILPSKYIVGGISSNGACLFGEIPDRSGQELPQTGSIPSTLTEACASSPEAVIDKPKAIVRRWGKAAKEHAKLATQPISVNTLVWPDSPVPAHLPLLQEAALQTTSPALLRGPDIGANPSERLVLPRNLELARSIVKFLRHKACDKGLYLDGDGFVALWELSRLRRFADASEEDIWNEANADAARFDVKVVGGCRMLRASYKHSGAMATSTKGSRFLQGGA